MGQHKRKCKSKNKKSKNKKKDQDIRVEDMTQLDVFLMRVSSKYLDDDDDHEFPFVGYKGEMVYRQAIKRGKHILHPVFMKAFQVALS